MKKSIFLSAISFVCLTSQAALAQTIFIRPGQCIQVGSQQVCSQVNGVDGQLPVDLNPIIESIFNCRLGEFRDSEFPEFKTHALFKIHVFKDGTKRETQMQNFGLHGKDACEKERKSAEKEQKALDKADKAKSAK